jgi:Lrp/AsnC family transcriptional regulator for asnA, asnC and gidA
LDDRTKIDEIDAKILKALLKNARTTYADIARECGVSSNSIRLRFERLQKTGIIKGSITQVNPKSLGYNYIAYIVVQAEATKRQYTYEWLKKTPNIIHITKLMGRYNLMIIVALTEVEELNKIVSYVKANPHVVNADFAIAWDLVKVDHHENLEIKER